MDHVHTFSVQAMVHGYHVYNLWDAACDDDILPCEREIGNPYNLSSVIVKKGIKSISTSLPCFQLIIITGTINLAKFWLG